MSRNLPNGCDERLDELDENGECRLSGLRPAYCGLPCHRDSETVPVVDTVVGEGWAA